MSEYSYDQGQANWLNDLLGRGPGDGDLYPACELCGAQPLTALCNNANCEPLESDTE